MHDVVNPPAASRYYAYCLLGAYDLVTQNKPSLPNAAAFIKAYPALSYSSANGTYDYRIASLYCILETGKQLLPSGYLLEEEEADFLQTLARQKVPKATVAQSLAVAKNVAAQIVRFSKTDHYNQLSAKLRYTPVKGDGMWYPTPPSYMEAVEPNWKIIRPLMIDSCNQFMPLKPTAFSSDSSSLFFQLAKEVYDVSKNPTPEQLQIASFWDCNPFAVATSGHLSLGFKKISPGGHWMNIGGIAATKAHLRFDEAIVLETVLAATIMDAFISCWDEKYRSNRIRPETYINRTMDARWQPLLQTPPFPEYPSGHSVISTAAAEVLTFFLGEHFSYTDNSEELFEIPPRSFSSFRQAAAEAAISRLYGGIHFRDAIENGQQQGKAIGEKIIERVKAAGMAPFATAGLTAGSSLKTQRN